MSAVWRCRMELSVLSTVPGHSSLHFSAPLSSHLQVQLATLVIARLGGTQNQYSQHTVISVKVETAFVSTL